MCNAAGSFRSYNCSQSPNFWFRARHKTEEPINVGFINNCVNSVFKVCLLFYVHKRRKTWSTPTRCFLKLLNHFIFIFTKLLLET